MENVGKYTIYMDGMGKDPVKWGVKSPQKPLRANWLVQNDS